MYEPSTIELRQKRGGLVKLNREILDKARTERRDLTAEEARQWDQRQREIDDLADQVEGIEIRASRGMAGDRFARQDALEADLRQIEPRQVPPANMAFGDDEGAEIRVLRPDQKLERRSYDDLPDGIKADDLSIGRFLRGIVTQDWRGAEAEKRTMSVGDATLGGFAVPSPMSDRLIDLARAQAVAIRAGARTIPMDSAELVLPRLVGDPTAEWLPENAEGSFSDLTFGLVRLRARTLSTMLSGSLELFEDATTGLDQFVRQVVAQVIALELDRVILRGSGGDAEPVGASNTDGILNIPKGATAIDVFDDFADGVEKLRSQNVPDGRLACIYHPLIARSIDKAADTTGQPLQPPPSWADLKKFTTTVIPSNLGSGTDETEIYMGDFSNVLVGIRSALRFEVTTVGAAGDGSKSAWTKRQVWLRAILRADVNVARPSHLLTITGVKPTA